MAPNYGQGSRRTAHLNALGGVPQNISSANSTQLGVRGHRLSARRERERARQTRRKRDSRAERDLMVLPRSPSPPAPTSSRHRLQDRMKYRQDNEGQGRISNRHGSSSYLQPQQGRVARTRAAREGDFSGDGGPVQMYLLHDANRDEIKQINNDNRDDASMNTDEPTDRFGAEPPPPRPPRQPVSTRPVQYSSAHHFPFNRFLHPPHPVLPATRREPIRMINEVVSPEPEAQVPVSSSAVDSPSKSTAKASDAEKHPVNTYKGNDPIKKRVQNKKLQLILAGRPMPKPRLNPDRMVLKCTGRKEYR